MAGAVSYAVEAPRMHEMAAWLRCNDVNPCDVPYPARVFVETGDGGDWVLRFDAYARSKSGSIIYDPRTDSFQYVERTAVMVCDPPMWWLTQTPPMGVGGVGSVGAEGSTDRDGSVTESVPKAG